MSAADEHPSLPLRVAGAAFGFAVFVLTLTLILGAMDSLGVAQQTIMFVGKAFTYTGFGVVFIGWKWPRQILAPAIGLTRKLFRIDSDVNTYSIVATDQGKTPAGLARTLKEPIQRGLFAVACFSLLPWAFMRLIRELWHSSDIRDYFHGAFIRPVSPWFESGWWWYTKLEWYDWPVLPAFMAIFLAFAWPYTGARILAWVRNAK